MKNELKTQIALMKENDLIQIQRRQTFNDNIKVANSLSLNL